MLDLVDDLLEGAGFERRLMDQFPAARLVRDGLIADLLFQLLDMPGFLLKNVATRAQNAFPLGRPARLRRAFHWARSSRKRVSIASLSIRSCSAVVLIWTSAVVISPVEAGQRRLMFGPLTLDGFAQRLLLLFEGPQLLLIFFLFLVQGLALNGLTLSHLFLEGPDFLFLLVNLLLPMGADAVHLGLAPLMSFQSERAPIPGSVPGRAGRTPSPFVSGRATGAPPPAECRPRLICLTAGSVVEMATCGSWD